MLSDTCIGDQAYSTRGVTCWSGNDDEAHAARHQFGAGGVISVTSNLIPGLFSSLMTARDDQQMDRCISCDCAIPMHVVQYLMTCQLGWSRY